LFQSHCRPKAPSACNINRPTNFPGGGGGGKALLACKADDLTAISTSTVHKTGGSVDIHNPIGLHGLLEYSFTFLYTDLRTSQEIQVRASTDRYRYCVTILYVDDVRTSQAAYASTACDRDCVTILYADDVRTSQVAYASTACYGDCVTILYVDDVRTSQEAHASTACDRDCVTILYADDVRTSQAAHASTACYGDCVTILYADDVRTSQAAYASNACSGDSFTLYFYLLKLHAKTVYGGMHLQVQILPYNFRWKGMISFTLRPLHPPR
jgi:hypothetical protein